MHGDPGAYYDWEKLFAAAGARSRSPRGSSRGRPTAVRIALTYATNLLGFHSCDPGGGRLPERPTSVLLVHTEPSTDAPLLTAGGGCGSS